MQPHPLVLFRPQHPLHRHRGRRMDIDRRGGRRAYPLKPDVPAANLLRIRAAGAGRNPRGFKSALCPVRRQVNPRILLHLPVRQLPVRGLVRAGAPYSRSLDHLRGLAGRSLQHPLVRIGGWHNGGRNLPEGSGSRCLASARYGRPHKGHCGPSRRQGPDANLDARRTRRRTLRGTPAALQGSHPDRTRA